MSATLEFIFSLIGMFAAYGAFCWWLYKRMGWNDAPSGDDR